MPAAPRSSPPESSSTSASAPRPPRSIIPVQGERGLLLGQTGSGKTNLAVWILERIETAPLIIYDTKGEPKFEELPRHAITETVEETEQAIDDPEKDYIIFRPNDEDPDFLDGLLAHHYAAWRETPAYIDEVADFHSSPSHPGPGLRRIYRKGRSRGITAIAGTQRPSGISPFVYSEAQHFYLLRLQFEDDRKKVAKFVPGAADLPNPPKHHFYYSHNEDEGAARLMKPVPLVGAGKIGYTDKPAEPVAEARPSENLGHVWIGSRKFLDFLEPKKTEP